MENKCLVTTLQGVVDNDFLEKFGYFNVTAMSINNTGTNDIMRIINASGDFKLRFNGSVLVSTNGGSYETFTAGEYNFPSGSVNIRFPSVNVPIKISLPKTVSTLTITDNVRIVYCDYFSYIQPNLVTLILTSSVINNNVINLGKNIGGALSYVQIIGSNIYLDVNELNLTSNLAILHLQGANIGGVLDSIKLTKGSDNKIKLALSNTTIELDVANIELDSSNQEGDISFQDSLNVYGDVGVLFAKLNSKNYLNTSTSGINFKNCAKLTGDIANCPGNFVTNSSGAAGSAPGQSIFTWGTRNSSDILAMEHIRLGNDVDKMLIDQATKTLNPVSSSSSWLKTISVFGTRTSASDAAVATLASKGVTINIITT